jgi:hypothetical protein
MGHQQYLNNTIRAFHLGFNYKQRWGGGLYAVNSPSTAYTWTGTNATAISWTAAVPMAILSNTYGGEVDIFRNSGNPLASNICVVAIWIQN